MFTIAPYCRETPSKRQSTKAEAANWNINSPVFHERRREDRFLNALATGTFPMKRAGRKADTKTNSTQTSSRNSPPRENNKAVTGTSSISSTILPQESTIKTARIKAMDVCNAVSASDKRSISLFPAP